MSNAIATQTLTQHGPTTLGGLLERRRLEHRARRLRLVVAALRERRSATAALGVVPRPLQQAIADFSTELSSVEARLDAAAAPPAARQRRGRGPGGTTSTGQ